MDEIPEHLLKRSAERRKALGLPAKDGDPAPEGADAPAASPAETPTEEAAEAATEVPTAATEEAPAESKGGVPAHLLERAKRRRAALAGDDSGAEAPAAGGGTATATKTRPTAAPTATGPGGHTQRLLTVVKSGSIQQTRAAPQDKVHTWPHLLVIEFACVLAITAGLLIFSALVRAPLLSLADVNQTPNPSKAPWYFLGLQELLTMFHPMVAGVTIPGMGLFLLMVAPYVDKNPSHKPNDRKFSISMFTLFIMFWAVLVIIGSFFRGPGFNFVFPWNDGIFFEL
ncbi:MAG TPA: menaquinol-cytochrome c reductase cytochrome b subunit [Acidimicrobiia bacterium]|nr:menaquinol-cytochrome c reductase cytochrome b subunit [Acidimicrobiia bacterium]